MKPFLKRFYLALLLAFVLPATYAYAVYPTISIWDNDQLATLGFGSTVAYDDAATITIDAAKKSSFSFTLTSTGRTLTIVNPRPGQQVYIYIKQDGTGSRTITTWTNMYFAAGTEPTLTATAGATDAFIATWSADLGKWYVQTAGLDFKA